MRRGYFWIIGSISAAGMLVGCHHRDQATPPLNSPQPVSIQTPRAMVPGSINTTHHVPSSMILGAGGHIQIKEADSGKVVVDTTVKPQTRVRFDPSTGISLNETQVVNGPLPAGKAYELVLERHR